MTNLARTTASFSVALAGNTTPPVAYQWFKNATNLLTDGGNISGATTSVLTLTNVLAADQGTVLCPGQQRRGHGQQHRGHPGGD